MVSICEEYVLLCISYLLACQGPMLYPLHHHHEHASRCTIATRSAISPSPFSTACQKVSLSVSFTLTPPSKINPCLTTTLLSGLLLCNILLLCTALVALNGRQLEGSVRCLIVKYAEDQHKKKELNRLQNLLSKTNISTGDMGNMGMHGGDGDGNGIGGSGLHGMFQSFFDDKLRDLPGKGSEIGDGMIGGRYYPFPLHNPASGGGDGRTVHSIDKMKVRSWQQFTLYVFLCGC